MRSLEKAYGKKFNNRRITDPEVTNYLFLKQLTSSMVSYCSCLSMEDSSDISTFGTSGEIAFGLNNQESSENNQPRNGCSLCTVEKSTGTLSVNTSEYIHLGKLSTPRKCSLILTWTSKTGALLASHGFLENKKPLKYLTIYVDFLPAFNVSKNFDDEHSHFAVAKSCNICRQKSSEGRWRKSKSKKEINYIRNKMNQRHKNCYKLVKYFTETLYNSFHRLTTIRYTFGLNINKYHLKTMVLQHSLLCKESSIDNYAKCVIIIFTELIDACKLRRLKQYASRTNLMKTYVSPHAADFYSILVARLCAVKENDTLETYLKRLSETNEEDIGYLNRRRKWLKLIKWMWAGTETSLCILLLIFIIGIGIWITVCLFDPCGVCHLNITACGTFNSSTS